MSTTIVVAEPSLQLGVDLFGRQWFRAAVATDLGARPLGPICADGWRDDRDYPAP